MEKYVDGFVIPIAVDQLEQYRRIAGTAGAIWKEYGALAYWECVGDDLDIADMVSFRRAAGAREGETVIFSWIVYASREHRDQVNKAVMADPRIAGLCQPGAQPFDYRRMVYGGFRQLVEF